MPPCEQNDVLDFWLHLLWVSKPEWSALFTFGGGVCDIHFLRFTSDATPVNLLMASMAARHFLTGMFQQR